MHKVQPLQSFDAIKVLADARRLDILRLLMAAPATGVAASSVVTHTSEDARPIFRCTPRLVTSAAART